MTYYHQENTNPFGNINICQTLAFTCPPLGDKISCFIFTDLYSSPPITTIIHEEIRQLPYLLLYISYRIHYFLLELLKTELVYPHLWLL